MIYLCTAYLYSNFNDEKVTQHTFYCEKTMILHGVEYYCNSNVICYYKSLRSGYESNFMSTNPFECVLPHILNIVEYKNLSERLDIVNNILDKLIFENV